jgi:DNA invertase Pin-like site-specific DNA recombinase
MKPTPLSHEKPKVFAYLRRSTKKEEQEMSLEKQYDSIPLILEEMGLSMADITQSFSDSFSGYKIKTIEGRPQVKRPGFRELVKTVRAQTVPCIIVAFNPSRLTRNVPDGTTIKEFLGHHQNKQKVQYIRFFEGIWDKTTPATVIDAEVHKAVAYSERLAQDKINNILTSLRNKKLPRTIKTPH